MALYQRGRTWYADFYLQGRRVQESTGTANKREAEKFYALRVSEVHRGEYAKIVKIDFCEFGKQYMVYAKANKRSWLRDQQIMAHLQEFFGTLFMQDIGPLSVERYKLERLASNPQVNPATINRELALLKHMFNMAEQWGLHRGRNPVKGVRFLDENNIRVRTLSDEEEGRLLKNCSPLLQDLVVFSLNTGLRHGDILNLKWEEVDLETGMIKLLIKKKRVMLEMPLNDQAMKIVRAWHGMRKNQWVFYNPETGLQFKDLWLGLQKACKKAGVENVTWHTFRHTFATRLNRSGADIVTVKELLGHSDIKMTMRYAHTNRDEKIRAVKRLGASSDKVVTIVDPEKKSA